MTCRLRKIRVAALISHCIHWLCTKTLATASLLTKRALSFGTKQIEALKEKGHPLAYVGDVVGAGSSRKSATNSILWLMGDDIPNVPNKRGGGLVLGKQYCTYLL